MKNLLELVDQIKADLVQSYDLRLQAAKNMVKARELVDNKDPEGKGMKWKEFATEHFDLSWSEVKKLVKIGSSKDPEKAMADHREKTRKSVAESRKSKQQESAYVGAPEKAEANGGGGSPKSNGESGGPEPTTVANLIQAYEAASNDARERFLQWLHDEFGYKVVPPDPPIIQEEEHRAAGPAMPAAA